MRRLIVAGLVAVGTAASACSTTTDLAPVGEPSRATQDHRAPFSLVADAAEKFIQTLNTLSGPNVTCRFTGPGRDAGRGIGYAVRTLGPMTVSTNTYSTTFRLDPAQIPEQNPQSLTVVLPPALRGQIVEFSAKYDGLEVIKGAGVQPAAYSPASAWPLILTQLVQKTEFSYSCDTGFSRRDAVHTIGLWDGLRLAVYPDALPPITLKETTIP